ncbi:MAG: hypothetical protein EOO50_04165 [Flavobacterium sp.]|uniref:PepSY-like domain-containing protein n=1 Tax=Flavobacterium sp. TaxID=239 RepID=UPI0011F888C8|nr:PepSY-like domain-containing protein [Flavobacterium sp.]RZJ67777.1 MAG: hypothetical protein EOO50_04165 [Flavobacterium sp.]
MKNIILFALLLSGGFFCTAQSSKISVAELPQPAKIFLSKHYKNRPVASCRKKDASTAPYEVRLAQGTAIKFAENGDWREVDGDGASLPKAMLPENVAEYIQANFPRKRITSIEKSANSIEVNLNGDIALAFDAKGQLLQ